MADATLTIGAEVSEAIKGIRKFQKETADSLKSVEGSFESLKKIAIGAVGFLAAGRIVDALGDVVDAALEVEKATASLKTQLKLTGEFSQGAVDDFKAYADELERTSELGDDLILSQLAVAKSFGVTNEQAKKMTTAAADLSAAMGISFDAAVQQLGKSFSGLTGKLDEQIPEIKKLTKAQLENGEAVDLVLKRYGGSAASNLDTFGGAVRAISVEWGNLKEAIGEVIIQDPSIRAVLKTISERLKAAADAAGDLDGAATVVKTTLLAMAASAGAAAEGVEKLAKAVRLLVDASQYTPIVLLGKAVAGLADWFESDKFKGIGGGLSKDQPRLEKYEAAVDGVRGALDSVGGTAKDAAAFFDELGVKIAEAQKSEERATKQSTKNTRVRVSNLEEEKKARAEAAKAHEDYLNDVAKSGSDLLRSLKEIPAEVSRNVDKEISEIREKMRGLTAYAASNPAEFAVKLVVDESELKSIDLTPLQASAAGAAAGLVAKMLDGAAGAKDLIASAAGSFADALLPGIGPAVSSIVSKLAQGPEETKRFVREFVKAVPEIIVAIGEAAPAFVEAAVDAFVNEGGAIKVGVAIARAMVGEGVAKSIGKQIGLEFGSAFNSANIAQTIAGGFAIGSIKIQQAFAGALPALQQSITNFQNAAFSFGEMLALRTQELLIGIPNAIGQGAANLAAQIGAAFADASNKIAASLLELGTVGADIAQGFIDAILAAAGQIGEALTPKIPGVSGAVGGGQGIIPDKVPVLGRFAAGGTVPQGFPNDSFSAFLSSGEMVIPSDDVARLRDFLDSNGGGDASGGAVAALLAQILAALNQPMQVATTATLNGNALADIILNLSRRNARLSA